MSARAALLVLSLSLALPAHGQRTGRDPAGAVRLRPIEATARRRIVIVTGTFRQVRDSATLAGGVPTRVSGGWLVIRAAGMLPSPSPCYRLAGAAERRGPAVTLNIEARPSGELCPPGATAFTYKLALRDMPPGEYRVRVLHSWRDRAYPAFVALDTTVTVARTRRSDFLRFP